MPDGKETLIFALAEELRRRSMMCASAESCTGGLIGAMLTAVPGSSEWYAGGVISYANSVKEGLLGVSAQDLEQHGAVSEPVVRAMAFGVCRAVGAGAGMAVSGVAGPGGGTVEKPVGTVWIGWCVNGEVCSRKFLFSGNRDEVRLQAARAAMAGLLECLKKEH